MRCQKIDGYENYLIYEDGSIWNLVTDKELKGSISENGYKYYRLSKDGKKKMFYAHRLVAQHFLDNPDNLPVVNHKDGNKLNNNVSNLEWVTQSENVSHAHREGLISKSNSSPTYYLENLPEEEWKQFEDFSNYLFSNQGRVRNIKTNRILIPSYTNGYLKVRLSKNGITRDVLIHKVVYSLWHNEPYLQGRDFIIDHIDADKTNNSINNLRKMTASENVLAAYYEQKTNSSIKQVQQFSLDGTLIATYPSASEAGRQLNLDRSSISKVCRGVNASCGGFYFRYI